MKHVTGDIIWKYLEDELAEAEREIVEAHFDVCDDCQELMVAVLENGGPLAVGEPVHAGESLMMQMPVLELPEPGFVDRVMEQVRAEAAVPVQDNVVPFPTSRRKPPRLEFLTRFVTAAVVTGFMVLGSTHVQGTPVFGVLDKVGETGTIVSDGTEKVYTQIYDLVSHMNFELFK